MIHATDGWPESGNFLEAVKAGQAWLAARGLRFRIAGSLAIYPQVDLATIQANLWSTLHNLMPLASGERLIAYIPGLGPVGGNNDGQANAIGGTLAVVRHPLSGLILHELGHLFGAPHTGYKPRIIAAHDPTNPFDDEIEGELMAGTSAGGVYSYNLWPNVYLAPETYAAMSGSFEYGKVGTG